MSASDKDHACAFRDYVADPHAVDTFGWATTEQLVAAAKRSVELLDPPPQPESNITTALLIADEGDADKTFYGPHQAAMSALAQEVRRLRALIEPPPADEAERAHCRAKALSAPFCDMDEHGNGSVHVNDLTELLMRERASARNEGHREGEEFAGTVAEVQKVALATLRAEHERLKAALTAYRDADDDEDASDEWEAVRALVWP